MRGSGVNYGNYVVYKEFTTASLSHYVDGLMRSTAGFVINPILCCLFAACHAVSQQLHQLSGACRRNPLKCTFPILYQVRYVQYWFTGSSSQWTFGMVLEHWCDVIRALFFFGDDCYAILDCKD